VGEDERAPSRKWLRRIGAALGAVAVAVLGFIGVAGTNHNDRLAEFRSAQNKCQQSLADTVNAIRMAADAAYEKRFQEPMDEAMPDVFAGMNNVNADCLGPPINWGSPEKWEELQREILAVDAAWLARDVPDAGGPDHSREETILTESAHYFDGISDEVRKLPAPSIQDSFGELVPW
jgi:hypothetical protein